MKKYPKNFQICGRGSFEQFYSVRVGVEIFIFFYKSIEVDRIM